MSVIRNLRNTEEHSVATLTLFNVNNEQKQAYGILDIEIRRKISSALGKDPDNWGNLTIKNSCVIPVLHAVLTNAFSGKQIFQFGKESNQINAKSITQVANIIEHEHFKRLVDDYLSSNTTLKQRVFLENIGAFQFYHGYRPVRAFKNVTIDKINSVFEGAINKEHILNKALEQSYDFVARNYPSSAPPQESEEPEQEENTESDPSSSTLTSRKRPRESEQETANKRVRLTDPDEMSSNAEITSSLVNGQSPTFLNSTTRSPSSSEEYVTDIFGLDENDAIESDENDYTVPDVLPQSPENSNAGNPVGIDSRYGINY